MIYFNTFIKIVNRLSKNTTFTVSVLKKIKDLHYANPLSGALEGTRTPDPLLRRQLLYPPELQTRMERVMGVEPTQPAWKAGILPLNYTRRTNHILAPIRSFVNNFLEIIAYNLP